MKISIFDVYYFKSMIFREAIKTRFRRVVSIDEPPHRISLAFAIGVFIAFSPAIGLHTISAVAAAWLFKMNRAVIIAGSLVSNPWTIVFVYGFSICFGSFILQNENSCFITSLGKNELMAYPKTMLMPYLTGTILLGIIVAFISYFLLYVILVMYKGKK